MCQEELLTYYADEACALLVALCTANICAHHVWYAG